jgi:hypothetical protein
MRLFSSTRLKSSTIFLGSSDKRKNREMISLTRHKKLNNAPKRPLFNTPSDLHPLSTLKTPKTEKILKRLGKLETCKSQQEPILLKNFKIMCVMFKLTLNRLLTKSVPSKRLLEAMLRKTLICKMTLTS